MSSEYVSQSTSHPRWSHVVSIMEYHSEQATTTFAAYQTTGTGYRRIKESGVSRDKPCASA